MNTVFVVISKDVIRRNILDTDFWHIFVASNKSIKIVLLVESHRVKFYEANFAAENVEVRGWDRESHKGFAKLAVYLARTGIYSHSTTLYRMRAHVRGEVGFLQTKIKSFIALTLGKSNGYKRLVRKLILATKTPQSLKKIFEDYKPDVVFCASMIDNNFDVLVSVEARRRNIRLIGMVRSWDNLNNHGLLPVVPDRFLLQNKWLKEAAEKFQAINTNKYEVDIIGVPHYDRYKQPEQIVTPKSEFFEQLGLDLKKKLIFLAGFDFCYSEDSLPGILNSMIKNGDVGEGVQVLFTQHPASSFTKNDYHIDELEHVTYLDLFSNKSMKMLNTEATFINLAYHSDVIVNVASTVSIDAAVLNKPVICVGFDDKKKLTYWEKAMRLHDSFDHYEKLNGTGGVKLAKSKQELSDFINEYLENPSKDADGRAKARECFVEPFDGRSGERLANILTEELAKVL